MQRERRKQRERGERTVSCCVRMMQKVSWEKIVEVRTKLDDERKKLDGEREEKIG